MNAEELRRKVFHLNFAAKMNQKYHQRTAYIWGCTDKALKIAIAFVAVVDVVAAVYHQSQGFAVGVALLAAALALALNVVPLGEREAFFAEMFRAWSDVRICGETLYLKVEEQPPDAEAKADHIERYLELASKTHQLNAMEPFPNKKRLHACEDEVRQSIESADSDDAHEPPRELPVKG